MLVILTMGILLISNVYPSSSSPQVCHLHFMKLLTFSLHVALKFVCKQNYYRINR